MNFSTRRNKEASSTLESQLSLARRPRWPQLQDELLLRFLLRWSLGSVSLLFFCAVPNLSPMVLYIPTFSSNNDDSTLAVQTRAFSLANLHSQRPQPSSTSGTSRSTISNPSSTIQKPLHCCSTASHPPRACG